MHWDALGATRLPCKVSVWTAWHTTSSKCRIFLEVSPLCLSCGHRFGKNDPVVFGVNYQLFFFCPGNWVLYFFYTFDLTLSVKCSSIWQALPVFAVCHGPLLSVLHDFSNWPVWHQSDSVFSFSPSQITSDAGNSRGPKPKQFFFLPKKYMSVFPHSVFSPHSSRLLFLDCFTICCSECL